MCLEENMIRAIQFQNKRVGSTFLQNALDSHPLIAGVDEVFVNMARKEGMKKSGFTPYVRTTYNGLRHPHHYLTQEVWARYPDKHVIFKLMYNQIYYHAGLFDFIQAKRLPVIHLMRRNLVKQVISGQNAATTKHNTLNLNPDRLFQLVNQVDQENQTWKKQFNEVGRSKLELYYEDIIGDTIDGFTFVSESVRMSLCEFFKVDVAKRWFCAATKKKNKNNIWVYLKDREAVEKKFKGTPYEWMVRDEN